MATDPPPAPLPAPSELEVLRTPRERLLWAAVAFLAWVTPAALIGLAALSLLHPELLGDVGERLSAMPLESWLWGALLILVGPGALLGLLVYRESKERGGVGRRFAQLLSPVQRLAGALADLGPFMLRPVLFVSLAAVLYMTYAQLESWNEDPLPRIGVVALCATPNLLTLCIALLTERRVARRDVLLHIPEEAPDGVGQEAWKARKERALLQWKFENELMRASVQRLSRHSAMFGFLATGVLLICAVIALRFIGALEVLKDKMSADQRHGHYLIPLATGTAALVSFTVHFGKVLFRSASNDATARMMAWAARALLMVSLATVFLAATLMSPSTTSEASASIAEDTKSALVIGIAAGLLGDRVLQAVTEQAARMFGIENIKPANLADLTSIDGITEDDVARLAEERIDSVHALAFSPTPRLFFNTTYSLQRICEWQDQAMLIAHFGRTKALLLRDQHGMRGILAARRLAEQFDGYANAMTRSARGQAPADGQQGDAPPDGQQGQAPPGERQNGEPAVRLQALAVSFGFHDAAHAANSLRAICEDEVFQRLEVFCRSMPYWQPDTPPGERARGSGALKDRSVGGPGAQRAVQR